MLLRRRLNDEILFRRLKKLTLRKRRQLAKQPEDINKSLAIVDLVLQDAADFRIEVEVVTSALKEMKENPAMQISDAIVAGYHKTIEIG